ncbi:hypothetical protein FI667_g7638, partial [Globisporangium splendens]
MFSAFYDQHEEYGGGRSFGAIAGDFVDVDELYPCSPTERVWYDATGVLSVAEEIHKKTNSGGEGEDELVVVLRRSCFVRMNRYTLAVRIISKAIGISLGFRSTRSVTSDRQRSHAAPQYNWPMPHSRLALVPKTTSLDSSSIVAVANHGQVSKSRASRQHTERQEAYPGIAPVIYTRSSHIPSRPARHGANGFGRVCIRSLRAWNMLP